MKKVLRVVISTNRVNYLARTFEACKKIDFSGLDVHHLLIDDSPKGRNDELFKIRTLFIPTRTFFICSF